MEIVRIVFCVLLCQQCVSCWDDGSLDKVLTALDRGVSHLDGKYTKLILDGVIGLRMISGQLKVLLDRIDDGLQIPQHYHDRIIHIQQKASRVSTKGLPFTLQAKLDPVDPYMVKMTSTNFWRIFHPSSDADVMLIETNKTKSAWNGRITDKCIVSLVYDNCNVTKQCWEYVTEPDVVMYHLTHQAFYFMIGEAAGCFDSAKQEEVNWYTKKICTNLLVEALSETQHDVDLEDNTLKLDVFMERLGFCGLLGFRQIAQPQWLERILSWQIQPEGCWGDINRIDNFIYAQNARRVKCYDHQTVVGSAAMAQYTRYITEHYYNGLG